MATREMTLGEASASGQYMINNWNDLKGDIKLKAVNMYSLLGIRKTMQEKAQLIQESVIEFARSAGGIEESGGVRVPDDKIEEVNAQLKELQEQTFDLEYKPITITADESLPIDLMDILFEFIIISED